MTVCIIDLAYNNISTIAKCAWYQVHRLVIVIHYIVLTNYCMFCAFPHSERLKTLKSMDRRRTANTELALQYLKTLARRNYNVDLACGNLVTIGHHACSGKIKNHE